MSIFNTEHKRKSAAITTGLMILLLFLMIFFGMRYLDPPEESGIAVNFGTTNVGSGNEQPKAALKPKTAPVEQKEEVEPQETETQPEEQEETTPTETASEEVVTQDSAESIAIKKAEEAKRKADEEVKKAKAEADRIAKEKKEAEEKLKQEQAEKRAKLDAMMNGVNNSDGTEEGGEGPGDGEGDKGNPQGDPYAASYYGAPGSGNGGAGGFGLNGRSKLASNKFVQECDKDGTIVVAIKVDRQGQVTDASYSPKGSTSTEKCLIDAAIKTAKSYKWNADSKAPTKQIGFIVVNFKLGQ